MLQTKDTKWKPEAQLRLLSQFLLQYYLVVAKKEELQNTTSEKGLQRQLWQK